MKIACSGQLAWASRANSRVSGVERAVAEHDAITEIVEVKECWRDRKTAALSLTEIGVDDDPHVPPSTTFS